MVGLAYFLATALAVLLVAGSNWAFVAALLFTCGSIVSSGIASSSSETLIALGQNVSLSTWVPPARAVTLKWAGTFRYAAAFLIVPFGIIFIGTGLDLVRWKGLLVAISYMLAVNAAATSLGVVAFAWLSKRHRVLLAAAVVCGLALIPVVMPALPNSRDAVGIGLALTSPIQAILALDATLAGWSLAEESQVSAAGFGIVSYAVAAAVLLRSRAKGAGSYAGQPRRSGGYPAWLAAAINSSAVT